MSTVPTLAVVIPVYNEFATLGAVLKEWDRMFQIMEIPYRFIVVNDGSGLRTLEELGRLQRLYPNSMEILSKENSGHGRACRAGYARALALRVDWVLQCDSDGQCDPVYFPGFWYARATADVVQAMRVQRGDGVVRTVVQWFCRTLIYFRTGVYVLDPNVPYRLIRATVLRRGLDQVPADFNLQNLALSCVLKARVKARWVTLPIFFRPRQGGHNTINLWRIMCGGLDALQRMREGGQII
jgi:glycosyltransferase involved in cell wall biosynthesis